MPDPTNGELAIILTSLTDKFDGFCDRNDTAHAEIKEQTSRTNGRVTKLEKWQSMTVGALLFANVLVVPIVLSVINKYLNR